MKKVPVIDISALIVNDANKYIVAREIWEACTQYGFFYISAHGISTQLQDALEEKSKIFFSLPIEEKQKIKMALGGHAWRGYFGLGNELTSGKPDLKEGIYFGQELSVDDERVKQGLLLHGKNLFPENIDGFKETVLTYIEQLKELGLALMRGISLSLGLDEHYINNHYTNDPLVLFRIFHYPPDQNNKSLDAPFGVGEHTDYGLLTILKQDEVGGLQIKVGNDWIEAPYLPNTFVCNIGDMLEILTKGQFRSTPHRVINTSGLDRFSYPIFFDPAFTIKIEPLPLTNIPIPNIEQLKRWDAANLHAFSGTYGEYITRKIGKVFPNLTV